MPASTLTSRGQVTIPHEIREALQLRQGQRLDFRVDTKGG
jgi:AbrB family looped-hinge helix DNA binding protein